MEQREYCLNEKIERFFGREEQLEKFQRQLTLYMDECKKVVTNENVEDRKTYVLDVYGIGGVGKTTLLKKMKNEIKRDCISVYIDTSGDSSYIDIIAKLRNELGNAFCGVEGESLNVHFVLFDLLYKIFFNSYKVKYPLPLWKILSEQSIEILKGIAGEILDAQELNKIDFNIVKELIVSLREKSSDMILKGITGSMKIKTVKILVRAMINGIEDIRENERRKEEIKLLENNLQDALKQGKLNSEYGRQRYLLNVFIKAIGDFLKEHATIFFIDNFRNNVENREIYQDYNWLTSEKGLIRSVPGFFVLGERDAIEYAICNGNSDQVIYKSIKLTGLKYENVKAYYKGCCQLCEWDRPGDVEQFMLRAALPDNDRYVEIDFSKQRYLPIYMTLAAEYYNEVKEQKRGTIVTVDDLGRINRFDDLWFYFEMNMSEVRRDAFYILSCLETWKEGWFRKVRERFDNYLLSAVHVLRSISSVEKIDYQELKLHDVIRDSLFKSSNNLIKFDVLEWLYLYFLHMQHIDIDSNIKFLSECDNKRGIDDIGELSTYVFVCKQYIESLKDKDHDRFAQEEAVSNFLKGFEKSLDLFDSPETVNEEIIEIVQYIIKNFKDFITNKEVLIELRNRLAFLCTHASRSFKSLKESIKVYEELMDDCKNLPKEGERSLKNYIFKLSNKNMKENSVAWNEGDIWIYDKAAEYGTAAVKEQYELMCEAGSYLDFTEEERKAYEEILDFVAPDNVCFDDEAKELFFKNVEIYKKSQYCRKYAFKWDVLNYKDLFVAYSKARGNIPWFYLRMKRKELREKLYSDKFDPVLFGKKTYYIRKAIYGDGEPTFRSKHNISVYLSKQGQYQEALEISEEVLKEIADFYVEKTETEKTEKEIEERIRILISLELIQESEIREAYHTYKDFLGYISLGIEVLQYNSSYKQRIAENYKVDREKFEAWMKDAKKEGVAALVLRYITLAEVNHREIFNSWSYLASYYYYLDEKETGIKIIQYLLELYHQGAELPEEKVQEFEMMMQDMQENIWEENRRFSEQKL
ncbi:MAG: ATP-binding protein [Eubacterium sp.]|nr:ATP-binding protein [Eubacterium sp.]